MTMAVQELYGCTSVVVVSEGGVYQSHHWESPGFANEANMRARVIDPLWDQERGVTENPALSPLTQARQRFDGTNSPSVFIITPYDRIQTNSWMYGDLIKILERNLARMLPRGTPIRRVGYHPLPGGGNDPNHLYTARGKVSIQYAPVEAWLADPRHHGRYLQKAGYKVFVEGRVVDYHTWIAESYQSLPQPRPRRGH